MSDDQPSDSASDRQSKLYEMMRHRPRMTYEGMSLVFNSAGDLVIEQLDGASEVACKVVVPSWQLDLFLAFIKQHRLSLREQMFAAFSAKESPESDVDAESNS